MTGVHQEAGEEPTAAAELDHDAVTGSNRLEQRQDPRRAPVGVEAEAQVVHPGQVLPVVRVVGTHRASSRGCGLGGPPLPLPAGAS